MKLIGKYLEALVPYRSQSLQAVVLKGVEGLLEGSALFVLIPVLQVGLGAENDNGWWSGVIEKLNIEREESLYIALSLFLALGTLAATAQLLANRANALLRAQIESGLRETMTRALFKMRWTEFLHLRLGDINKAALSETTQTALGCQGFVTGLGALLISITYLFIAFTISVHMTALTLVFAICAGGLFHVFAGKAARETHFLNIAARNIGNQITEIVGNLKFFRASGLIRQANENASATYRHFAESEFRAHYYGFLMRFCLECSAIVFVGIFLAFVLVIRSEPIAEALVFLGIFYRMLPRVLLIQESFLKANSLLTWYESWRKRIDMIVTHEEDHGGSVKPEFAKEITLRKVEFRYSEATPIVLRDIDTSISKGECLAIVGESGSGKSTLVDILLGLSVPSNGQVSIDNIPLRDINMQEWRANIGIVMQESPILHASIASNVAFGDPKPNLDKIREVCEKAYIWDFIQSLPSGLHTEVGEKGGRSSGGERQRIALARALYKDPWLLILDEATSSLDGNSEGRIQEALRKIRGETTIVMVAHRLKTVQIADNILVLENGVIAEEGTWSTLLRRKDGVFGSMVQAQGL